jgi:maleate isomerase
MTNETTLAHDNWGWRARIGMFIVGSEAVPEAEWAAMAPSGVSVHAARVSAGAPWARWRADKSGVDLADDLLRGAKQFAAMRLTAVVLGHTTSSVVGGPGWDAATASGIAAVVGEGALGKACKVTTNGLDTMAALRASGVKRPFLVLPPWFPDDTVKTAVRYYTDHGFTPAGHHRMDPGRKWRDVPPGDLYGLGMGFEQEVEPLYAQIRAACPADADGVLIGGTGFRCVAILETLEQDLGRPAISANQASLWHCLRLSGVRTPVPGYGNLLRLADHVA